MDKREFKDKVYTILARLVKAMANPHRLEIIDLLSQGERGVEEIALQTNMSVANASQHLQTLKESRLVEIRREGNFIRYRLANDNVYRSWKDLQAIGMENLAEVSKIVNDYRAERNSFEPVTLDELQTRMKSKKVVLLDVRPEYEYNAGHIPDAVNIPVDLLSKRIKDLNKDKEYVAYCRGPFCVFADEAVALLAKKGFKAWRMEAGYPDWKLKYSTRAR
jgi:rhodanese-related sulfurtransferase